MTPEQAAKAKVRKRYPQPNAECYLDRIPQEWKDEWKDKVITREDWAPEDAEAHCRNKEFRKFISSSIPRFDKIQPYKMFWLYIEQCMRWLADGVGVQDFNGEEQRQYAMGEMERGLENRMYWAIKYGYIKDDALPGGYRKYDASTPQALLFWLRACKFSGELGKSRQGAITSTMMLDVAIKMLTNASFTGVLVSDDKDFTGKTILDQKLKASIQMMTEKNPWMDAHEWLWARTGITAMWKGTTTGKKSKGTYSSTYTLAGATEGQTINGTQVSEIDVDECQNVSTYQDIKLESRPAQIVMTEDGMSIGRILWAYGTGNKKHSGGGSFENEYKSTLRKWLNAQWDEEGKITNLDQSDTSVYVGLFFDRTTRPGMTDEKYLEEYNFYMNSDEGEMAGMTKEDRLAVFLSAYPNKPEDMFLTSHKTIVPKMMIVEAQDLILEYCHSKGLPIKGYLEPVFNTSLTMPEGSWYPYLVTGTKWMTLPPDSLDAPLKKVLDPDNLWINRYYQGTDPIQSSGGTSKFASAIWDNVGVVSEQNGQLLFRPLVACILNHRTQQIEECFNQSILMGMHYRNHDQAACMELFEVNKGEAYERWKKSPIFNLEKSLWYRMALPAQYNGGQHVYGIDMKNNTGNSRKSTLFLDIVRFNHDHGPGYSHKMPSVPFYEYWTQIHNIEVEEKPNGAWQFGTINKNAYNDDLVFAVQYAYLSCMTGAAQGQTPKKLTGGDQWRIVDVEKLDMNTLQVYTVKEKRKVVYA